MYRKVFACSKVFALRFAWNFALKSQQCSSEKAFHQRN